MGTLLRRVLLTSRRGDVLPTGPHFRIYWTTDHHVWSVNDGGPGEDPEAPNATLGTRWFWIAPSRLRAFVAAVNAAHALGEVDYVLHSGDMLQSGVDWAFWNSMWDDLDPDIPQIVVPGNHDFAGGSDYAVVAAGLRRDTEPMIARSQFNRSFQASGSGVEARIIVFDTNMDAEGEHKPITAGIIHPDVLDWLEEEIGDSPEDLVLLISHHSPHETVGHFDPASALALRSVVEAAVASRPTLRVVSLFGHYHAPNLRVWKQLGPNLPGYSAAAACEDTAADYCVVKVYDGAVVVEEWAW